MLTLPNIFCHQRGKFRLCERAHDRAEISWQISVNGDNQNRQTQFITGCRTERKNHLKQSAASAAVQDKTGNFERRTIARSAPSWAYQCLSWGVSSHALSVGTANVGAGNDL